MAALIDEVLFDGRGIVRALVSLQIFAIYQLPRDPSSPGRLPDGSFRRPGGLPCDPRFRRTSNVVAF